MGRVLALALGATIAATLLMLDTILPLGLLQQLGFKHGYTVIIGLVVGVLLIVLTDNSWFEDLVGVRDIDVLPAVFRWASYVILSVSLVLIVSDFSPQIANATGLPVDNLTLAIGSYISAGLAGLYKIVSE